MTLEPLTPSAPGLRGGVLASQRWRDLVFLHWHASPQEIQPLLPPRTYPDIHNGHTWVGLIGFVLSDATLFGSPPVPHFGTFAEINVRLYAVDDSGRRGVVFLSLEASRLAAVLGARAAFSIPYFWSRTRAAHVGSTVGYSADRFGPGRTRFAVRHTEDVVDDDERAFLTARWGLFTRRRGATIFLPNEHEPWLLYSASVQLLDDELLSTAGLSGFGDRHPDSVLYSPGVTARFGRPERV